MGEITMPAELTSAMNIFGGADPIPLNQENVSQNGSFGSILGFLMTDAGQASAPIQSIPEITDVETSAETAPADILAAALAGNENAELPEVFSEKGITAFIQTVSRLFENEGEVNGSKDIEKIWNDISSEEKSAFAELLYAAADISEDGIDEIETTAADIPNVLEKLALKAAKKLGKKGSEMDTVTDESALVQELGIRFCSVQTASVNDASLVSDDGETAVSLNSAALFETAENSVYPESTANAPNHVTSSELSETAVSVTSEKSADIPAPATSEEGTVPTAENKLCADIRSAFEKLFQADSEELTGFCRKLADELKLSVSAKDTDTKAPESSHIDFGRQNMQGFMARLNKPIDELPADAVIFRNAQSGEVTESTPIPETDDISSQIIRRIDLYNDIFTDNFSGKEIEMKLAPEELGSLEIKIRRSENGFDITFIAEKAEAAELISKRTSELAEAMAARGIALKEISVSNRIMTSESDGTLTENSFSSDDGLYGGAQGENGSDRHFAWNGDHTSDNSSEQSDDSAENILNREAKLWVSA